MVVQEHPRTEAERWRAALAQATEECLDVLVCEATGQAFVESASHPGTLYAVSTISCSCPAGQRGLPCKHVACYRAQVGILALDADPLGWSAVA